jgi:hypothetical protein
MSRVVQTARYNRFSIPALRVGTQIDVAHVAGEQWRALFNTGTDAETT